MKTGNILHVHHPLKWYKPFRYISAAIRFFTKSYWNHTAIIVHLWGRCYVAEAVAKGVIITPFEEWKKDLIFEIIRVKTLLTEKELATRIMSKQGHTGYDFSGTLFFQLIFQLTGHWLGTNNEKRAEKRMYCSEYIAWIYDLPEWWKKTPDDINNYYLK